MGALGDELVGDEGPDVVEEEEVKGERWEGKKEGAGDGCPGAVGDEEAEDKGNDEDDDGEKGE